MFLHFIRRRYTINDKPNTKVNCVAYLKMIYSMKKEKSTMMGIKSEVQEEASVFMWVVRVRRETIGFE